MGGKGLGALIRGFLAADGFAVDEPAPHCLRGRRQRPDGPEEQRFIWFTDPDNAIAPEQDSLLADFGAAREVLGPHALGFFVVPTMEGLPTAFRQAANASGIRIRVPVQFFDTAYRIDDTEAGFGQGSGSEAGQVFRDFHRHGAAIRAGRVRQPFEALTGLGERVGGFSTGDDLLAHLEAELAAPHDGPRLTILMGHAGAGKSHLFAALFASLHERFLEEKRRQRLAARPVLFLPEHIRDKQVSKLDGLLEAVSGTEAGAATSLPLMRYLNHEGFTLWMFDGLDEFFAGETDFVAALEAGLAAGSRARMLICTRDSLLTSSGALSGLIERNIGHGTVQLYELARWDRPQQRALAWLKQTGRLPDPAAADPPDVAAFLAALDASPAAAELATLPFYCDLMLNLAADADNTPEDELDLLARIVDGLVDREQEKLAAGELGFRWDVFSGADAFVGMVDLVETWGPEAFGAAQDRERLLQVLGQIGRERLMELIEGIAHHTRMTVAYPNEGAGLTTEQIEDLANFYLDVGLAPDLEPRVLLALVQFAFFQAGDEAGSVRFAHEIVADFLAAREAARILRARPDNPDAIGQALGVRQDLDQSIVLRYLLAEFRREPDLAAAVRSHIEQGHVRQRGAVGAAQLLAAMQAEGL